MKLTQNKVGFFLLSLYAVIVMHGCIAHPYDSELGSALCQISSFNIPPISDPSENICEKDIHFNILSDEFQTNIKKTDLTPAEFAQTGLSALSPAREHDRPNTPYRFEETGKPSVFLFCLRSPPRI